MDRVTVYPGQVPLESDILRTNKAAMVGLAKLIAATLDTSAVVNGLVATPGTGLNVQISGGEIYALDNIDSTAYSSLPADTAHQIVKQGIMLDAATLPCPAPGTTGQSIAYLVEAKFADADNGNALLPYYNSSNPSVVLSGPGGSGVTQPTSRSGTVVLQIKAGTAATTGSQVTPSADTGFMGLWVVTVPYGAATITTGMIAAYSGANFLGGALLTQFRNHLAAANPHPQYQIYRPAMRKYFSS